AEHRRHRADGEREGAHGGDQKSWGAEQPAPRMTEIRRPLSDHVRLPRARFRVWTAAGAKPLATDGDAMGWFRECGCDVMSRHRPRVSRMNVRADGEPAAF